MRFLRRRDEIERSSRGNAPTNSRHLDGEHGTTYQTFVERQLSDERKRFESLESKGNSLVSGSGTLVTLILAIGTLAPNRGSLVTSPWLRVTVIVGFTLFTLAAIAGLFAIKTRKYKIAEADALDKLRKSADLWKRSEPAARGIVMQFDIDTIRTLRKVNNDKAWWVARGRLLQILATLALAAAAAIGLSA